MSADWPLGVPFNISQYAILTHMIAQVTGHVADEFIWQGGDCHVYSDQHDGCDTQQLRTPIFDKHATVRLTPSIFDIDKFTYEDIVIENYESHPIIKFPQAAV